MLGSLKHSVRNKNTQRHSQCILLVVFLIVGDGFVWICLYFCNNFSGRKNNDVNSICCVPSAEHWVQSVREDRRKLSSVCKELSI